jgi:hypothetical protein
MAINQSEQLAPVREMRISVEQHGEVEVDARAAGKAQITAPRSGWPSAPGNVKPASRTADRGQRRPGQSAVAWTDTSSSGRGRAGVPPLRQEGKTSSAAGNSAVPANGTSLP